MAEPLNLVSLMELLHLERRSRAPILLPGDLLIEVENSISEGDIQEEERERALTIVNDIIFLRRRKVLLISADLYSGSKPVIKALRKDEKELMHSVVDLLKETDPLKGGGNRPAEPNNEEGSVAKELDAPKAEPIQKKDPPSESPPKDVNDEPSGGDMEDKPEPARPRTGEVVVRALEDMNFVNPRRTYIVKQEDVFTVDPGTADLLFRSGKAVLVRTGDGP